MRLEQYITEKASKNVIVVDIQPEYEHAFKFHYEFTEFLNTQSKQILYFYNGTDSGLSNDDEREMKYWLLSHGLEESKLNDITFVDKGYGFFRCLMDYNIDNNLIIKMIRYMFKKKVWDSRDIEMEEWEKVLGPESEYARWILNGGDHICIPDIGIKTLKKFSGGYIVGGGRKEFFYEVKLLMSAFNVRATEVKRFIY